MQPTLEELYDLAEQNGYGEGFKTIVKAASRHGLYPRLFKHSVMYTSPANKAYGLFTLWARPKGPRKLIVGASQKNWAEIYSVDQQTFDSIMGPEGWRLTVDLPPSTAKEFVARLDRMFDSVKTG